MNDSRSACSSPVCGCGPNERPYDDCGPAEHRWSISASLAFIIGTSAVLWTLIGFSLARLSHL